MGYRFLLRSRKVRQLDLSPRLSGNTDLAGKNPERMACRPGSPLVAAMMRTFNVAGRFGLTHWFDLAALAARARVCLQVHSISPISREKGAALCGFEPNSAWPACPRWTAPFDIAEGARIHPRWVPQRNQSTGAKGRFFARPGKVMLAHTFRLQFRFRPRIKHGYSCAFTSRSFL